MSQPLAMIVFEELLPGRQLVNRLQDLGYRVLASADSTLLLENARKEKPLVVLLDMVSAKADPSQAIAALKQDPETQHIPVVAYAPDGQNALLDTAHQAGATLVSNAAAILDQLPRILDRALEV